MEKIARIDIYIFIHIYIHIHLYIAIFDNVIHSSRRGKGAKLEEHAPMILPSPTRVSFVKAN